MMSQVNGDKRKRRTLERTKNIFSKFSVSNEIYHIKIVNTWMH